LSEDHCGKEQEKSDEETAHGGILSLAVLALRLKGSKAQRLKGKAIARVTCAPPNIEEK
jgi:hypothetical protein